MLETWVWEQHLIEIGDIHITMDDLHRTVHILHIICIHILHDANDLEYMTGSMLTRIVNIEPVFSLSFSLSLSLSLSLSSFSCWSNGKWREKLVLGGATENDEKNWFGLMWNSFTNQTRNKIWFAMLVAMNILSLIIYKAIEQNLPPVLWHSTGRSFIPTIYM